MHGSTVAPAEDKFVLAAEFNPYPQGALLSLLQEQARRYSDLFDLFVQYSDILERVTFWGVWDAIVGGITDLCYTVQITRLGVNLSESQPTIQH